MLNRLFTMLHYCRPKIHSARLAGDGIAPKTKDNSLTDTSFRHNLRGTRFRSHEFLNASARVRHGNFLLTTVNKKEGLKTHKQRPKRTTEMTRTPPQQKLTTAFFARRVAKVLASLKSSIGLELTIEGRRNSCPTALTALHHK